MLIALAGVAMPVFWLGMLAILLFSLQLGWLPSFGRGEPFIQAIQYWLRTGDPSDVVDALRHLVLPALTLGAFSAALISRLVRSALLEVLGQDYVRTARAKGSPQMPVISRHALPNALIPVVTVIGLQVGTLLGGAIIAETIFAWPGIGRLLIQAISQRDYPLVQGIVLLTALAVSLINLLVDLALRGDQSARALWLTPPRRRLRAPRRASNREATRRAPGRSCAAIGRRLAGLGDCRDPGVRGDLRAVSDAVQSLHRVAGPAAPAAGRSAPAGHRRARA